MQKEQVLELIEEIVRPLRQRIEYLEKINEELRTQISVAIPQRTENPRLRSRSREDPKLPKREQQREVRSPSIKKKDDKPVWNYGKAPRQENGIYKSPPPVDKNKYKQVPARVSTRPESKQKNTRTSNEKLPQEKKEGVQYLSFEKQKGEAKKIMGGQKFSGPNSINGGSVNGQNNLKQSSVLNGKNNPESNNSHEASSRGGSQLLTEEQNSGES